MTDKTWIELREPRCVPERKGPFRSKGQLVGFLREAMQHRPSAYITVITEGDDGPLLQDGPECLQMMDGRSMSVGRRHTKSSAEAHAVARAEDAPHVEPGGEQEALMAAWDDMDKAAQRMVTALPGTISAAAETLESCRLAMRKAVQTDALRPSRDAVLEEAAKAVEAKSPDKLPLTAKWFANAVRALKVSQS